MAVISRKRKKEQRWSLRVIFMFLVCSAFMMVLLTTQVDDGSGSVVAGDEGEEKHALKAPSSLFRQQQQPFEFQDPLELLGAEAVLKMNPIVGKHRPDSDAVFGFASGAKLPELLRWVGTLVDTGYDGDIVLGVNKEHELDDETLSFLRYHAQHHHLVAYPAELVCKKVKMRTRCKVYKMFLHRSIGGYLPDPRPFREVNQLRFDYYWAWSTLYTDQSRIFLLDTHDVYFQSNPFDKVPTDMVDTLMTFQENPIKKMEDDIENKIWQQEKHEIRWVRRLGRKTILVASAVVGGQPAVETYCRAMMEDFELTECQVYGCEQGNHNYLFWSSRLKKADTINQLVMAEQGKSAVNTLRILIKYAGSSLKDIGTVNDHDQVVNIDGEPSPVVHQYETDPYLNKVVARLANDQREKWTQIYQAIQQNNNTTTSPN